jgi:hypothetical protein
MSRLIAIGDTQGRFSKLAGMIKETSPEKDGTVVFLVLRYLLRAAKVMQRIPTILLCVYGRFVVVVCCIIYVAFYNGRSWAKAD